MIFLRQEQALRRLSAVLLVAFAAVLLRLWWVNGWQAADYVALAQNQRLLTVAERQFERGDFLDRHGETLTNRPQKVLLVFPTLLRQDERHSAAYYQTFLAALLQTEGLTPTNNWRSKLADDKPFVLARGLTDAQAAEIQQRLGGHCGVFVPIYRPRYAENSPLAHLLGYVGEAENTGKCGLEQQYDAVLQGRPSVQIAAAVDERGRQAADQLRQLPAGGADEALNVRLTVDYSYQQICEQAMQGKNGAAVLLDAQNGDVLAMASAPNFDQSVGQPAADGDIYLNKALAYYPPASVFKIVLTAAALEENISLDGDSRPFVCSGSITLPNGHSVNCWQTDGHGEENLAAALANSCNPYFVALGQKLGGKKIAEYAWRLGLTEQILRGYEVNSANMLDFSSAVPGDVANVSIGEKGIRTTPLMIARMLAAVANGGKLPEARLVMSLETAGGQTVQSIESAEPRQVISSQTAHKLANMLRGAVQQGTGRPVNSPIISIGGKTGTSQHFGVWFAGFFPADKPRWTMAVYLADGTSGGGDAGAVCREVAEKLALLEDIAHQSSV